MKYPLGIQSFEKIREGGFLYMDKTAMVYDIVKGGTYYFLSRPRRFGKSLLISTLEAYFRGRKELFKGLAIEGMETEWNAYPVLTLSLNVANYDFPSVLEKVLNDSIDTWCKEYGISVDNDLPSLRFKNLLAALYEKTGRKVVVLVDEYDKPLLATIDDDKLQTEMRKQLKAFYGILKPLDGCVQFGFFTGVTKFSKVSVFSDLNNLTDITMDHRYVELCGITEQEIHQVLDAEVGELAQANGLTKEACYDKLRLNYDGYHFEHDTVGVYNPFSLLHVMDAKTFKDYWFETGTPTILVEALKHNNYQLDNLTHEEVTADLLGSIDSVATNPLPLFYQSGYLTIKDYDERFESYHLGFPNREVERGFSKFLIPYYTAIPEPRSAFFINNFVRDVESGRAEQFMQRLESLFSQGDYQVVGDAELYFQNACWVIFQMMGFYTEVERHTTDGRMDMLIQTSDYIYILEFKLDKSADEALRQIEERQYAKPFEHDGRRIYKIGVNFSTKTRRMEGWKIAGLVDE